MYALLLDGGAPIAHHRCMRATFLGAAGEVTGSMLRLDCEAGAILIDCGMFQGRRSESRARNRDLPKEARTADAAILTHAHIDHSGNLPTLVKSGFTGPVFATPATYSLATYMLRDSARIQQADAEYLNRKNAWDASYVPIAPLYTEEDVVRTLSRFRGVPYREAFEVIPGVQATFYDAGHLLGSATVVISTRERGVVRRIAVSGDLGRAGMPILRDPELPPSPLDYVVMESTYGDRVHGEASRMEAELERVVKAAIERGGKIVVPAFAVGRTQELLLVLHSLLRAGRIPPLPVFVDSPLAIDATTVFRMHPECFDEATRDFLEEHGDPFSFPGLRFTRTREESMAINDVAGPAIVIAAAGMAEAGRILHHLRNNVEDPNATILVVGWMAQHTLGRRLVERQRRVRIWGVERDLNARVEVLNVFSAHADREDLLRWARGVRHGVRKFFLVHGEPAQQTALATAMRAEGLTTEVPVRKQVVELD